MGFATNKENFNLIDNKGLHRLLRFKKSFLACSAVDASHIFECTQIFRDYTWLFGSTNLETFYLINRKVFVLFPFGLPCIDFELCI